MRNGDEASPGIILARLALLVKMLITLEACGSFGLNLFFTYVFYHCPATSMQNSDEALLSIIWSVKLFLMKMLISLEPCGIFGSSFVYKCILTLSSRWYAER